MGCRKLQEFELDTSHPYFTESNNCLVSKSNKSVVFGKYTAEVSIPSDSDLVTSLGKYCFAGNNKLAANLEIPENIIEVDSNAFNGCSSLESITFENSNTTLGATCFMGCNKLKTVTLPNKIEQLLSYVFDGCALESINLPASIKKLGDHAFGNLSNTVVTFVSGVNLANLDIAQGLGLEAFAGCSNITFNLPWSKDEHKAKFGNINTSWGAKPARLMFSDGTISINAEGEVIDNV